MNSKRIYTFNDNHNNAIEYSIQIDDVGEEITIYLEEDKIGTISLDKTEHPNDMNNYYLIKHLDLKEIYSRKGIGTNCLRFHKELFDSILYARPDDGQTYVDGSHLTGYGLPFIEKMKELKIVALDPSDQEYEDDDR
ncbi:hypothetical protein AB7038_05385 [Morganella morganii]|uniref:hypothetical protein n=1 Tax=Morganella morganii TaxID=582 RepID=UPI0034E599B1